MRVARLKDFLSKNADSLILLLYIRRLQEVDIDHFERKRVGISGNSRGLEVAAKELYIRLKIYSNT